jgi:flagellar biosynthesis GTPase FlhF
MKTPSPVQDNPPATPATHMTPNVRMFRIVVGSAGEAVSLIQKKFGNTATVQSVKQIQPKGVSKLWHSPKLEIVVSVPQGSDSRQPFAIPDQTKVDAKTQVSNEEAMPSVEEVAQPRVEKSPPVPKTTASPDGLGEKPDGTSLTIEELLRQSEFDNAVLQRIKSLPQWNTLAQRSLQQALTEVVSILREDFLAAQCLPAGPFAAFAGMQGTGKSTMLRKYVANRVFIHGKRVQILKLEDEEPNPDDLLNVFCDIIGAPLVRDANDLKLEKGTELYIDLPGISRNRPEHIRHFRSVLDDLNVQTRVWVMNSLYDTRTLTHSYELARKIGASHQAFTHLDELESWAKLWRFVIKGSLPLVFLNQGDETNAATKEDFLPLLISRTFPKILLNSH